MSFFKKLQKIELFLGHTISIHQNYLETSRKQIYKNEDLLPSRYFVKLISILALGKTPGNFSNLFNKILNNFDNKV